MSTSMVRSASPNPASSLPQTKREKRRTLIADKLQNLRESFDSLQPDHYYAQLTALQCDINLIMRADPYRGGPLDDSADEIARLLAEAREEITRKRQPIAPEAESSFSTLAGRAYTRFVEDINGSMEKRDADMTAVYTHYQDGMAELKKSHAYKVQLAQEEHRLLSRTLRDRLVQAVTQKKVRLLKDKEQLDIADSNALLLNPSQFSIGNPASPGGLQNPRKTRNTRGRLGEGDEPSALSAAEVNKRKRKAAFDDRDEGSPAPVHRVPAEASAAPYADAKAKAMHAQFEAPLYSIDRLFTEKELAMNMNRSHVATTDYFERLRAQGIESRLHQATANANAPNGNGARGEGADGQESNGETGDSGDAEQAPQPTYHATRSANRTAGVSPLDSLASVADATSKHQLPHFIASVTAAASKSNVAAPNLPSASEAERDADLALMRAGAADPRYDRIVQSSCEKLGPGLSWGDSMRAADGGAADPDFGGFGGADASGPPIGAAAMAMAKSSSSMGILGALPMSKTMSQMSEGGVSMRRTASARGGP